MRTGVRRLLGVSTALATLLLAGGCAASARLQAHAQAQRTVRRSGLVVDVRTRESGPAGTVQVVVRAEDLHAPGALSYAVRFGDGAVAQDRVPQFCVRPPGPRRKADWHLAHHYARAGAYRISVRVSAGCATAVTASVRLRVG